MDKIRFSQLAGQVAANLGLLRDETWTAGEGPYGREYSQLLTGPGQARLHLDMYWTGEGKVTVTGQYPEGAPGGRRTYQAGVSPDRGAAVIAREANRRVIAAGYADDLLLAIEAKRQADRRAAERAGWLAQAAELFGVEPNGDGKLYLRQFVTGNGYVESYGWGEDTGHLSINLSGIPAQVALAMLAQLASSQDVRASCCFAYGPDHHPRFSVTGCLYPGRPDREGGEQPSRVRVYGFLTRSRGLAKDAVVRAMDEARAQGAGVIEPDGQVLAVVSWDHEGCGEYTAEVPRKAS